MSLRIGLGDISREWMIAHERGLKYCSEDSGLLESCTYIGSQNSPHIVLLLWPKIDRLPGKHSKERQASPSLCVKLKDVKVKQLSSILDFMYNGRVQIEIDLMESFLATAHELGVKV